MGLRLIDAEGRDVAAGQEGEICCDGPSVHLGYHNNPDANAEGYVAYPNVNPVAEMVDLMSATRAYEANVQAVNATKRMSEAALSIGG